MNIWGWAFIGLMAVVFLWGLYLGWKIDVNVPPVLAVIFCCSAVGYVIGLGAADSKTAVGVRRC